MAPVVRAKFKIQTISHHAGVNPGDFSATVVMVPVYGEGDNASWSKYTPSGKLEMLITNEAAVDAFTIGEEYFLDFTPAGIRIGDRAEA